MQTFVDNASSMMCGLGATHVKTTYIPSGRIIDPNNPLLGADVNAVATAHHNGSRVITQEEFSTFLIASSLTHSLDGWIYLSHAIESLLKGDKAVAVHLAYYAELRSTMSFLAVEGIAVLNQKHLGIQSSGTIVKYDGSTHAVAWDALNKYTTSLSKPKDEILKVFSYQGRNFLDWFKAIPNSSSLMSDRVITEWLSNWSFDITLFNSDRKLRNEVSYRPKKLSDNNPLNVADLLQKLTSFWNLLEPQSVEKFGLLDQFLLKKLFNKVHSDIELSLGRPVDFNLMLEDTFRRLRLTFSPANKSFFNSPNDHQIFQSASNNAIDPINGIDPLSIIARATLFLRLTIGYSSGVLKNAGVTKRDLEFFTGSIGVNSGLWETASIPNDYSELWPDVGEAIYEISAWHNGRTSPGSFKELHNQLAHELICYKQFNRAGFWGMSL